MMRQLEKDLKSLDVSEILDQLRYADQNNATIFSCDDVFNHVRTVMQVLRELGKTELCTIYNYEILEILVQSLDCEEAITTVNRFTKCVNDAAICLLDLPQSEYDQLKLSGTKGKLIIKCEKEKIKFAEETIIRRAVYECFKLSKGSIVLVNIEEGCTALSYKISMRVQQHLIKCKITASEAVPLYNAGITHLVINDEMELSVRTPSAFNNNVCTYFTVMYCMSKYAVFSLAVCNSFVCFVNDIWTMENRKCPWDEFKKDSNI